MTTEQRTTIAFACIVNELFRRIGCHGPVKSFEHEIHTAGNNLLGQADRGVCAVASRKIVGSVGRAETLRAVLRRRPIHVR
jgi:hypothetical protein